MPHNKRMQRTAKPLRALSAADAKRYAALLTYHKQYIYYLWYVDRL